MEAVEADGPELAHWQRWHTLCALGKLPEEERRVLVTFIGNRFLTVVRRLNRREVFNRLPPPPDRAHCFESWCALHTRREGKRYKDWLLNRGNRQLGAIESGVSLLMRKVVREWLAVEFHRHPQLSLDAPMGEAGYSLESLLPAPPANSLPAEAREWRDREVPGLVAGMSPLQCICVSARAQGRVLSDPRVCDAAKAGKTTLHKQYRDWVQSLAASVRSAFPDFSEAEQLQLALETLHKVEKAVFLDFSAEKPNSGGCKES